MKNIMIYSKHGMFRKSNAPDILKNNCGILMLFAEFCSGILTGSSAVFASGSLCSFTDTLHGMGSGDYILRHILIITVLWFILFAGGLSCCGAISRFFVFFILGVYDSVFAAFFLLRDGMRGMGVFSLRYLTGFVITAAALLLYGSKCSRVSCGIIYNTVIGEHEKTDIKGYLLYSALIYFICLIGILLNGLIINIK